jgi:broad specificity phosphatase PhoE
MTDQLRLPSRLTATLVLVRHGESTWIAEGRFQGRLDPPLSPLGERQARLVGQRLADRRAGAPLPIPAAAPLGIWHSPLSRAAQTARAIAEAQPSSVALRPVGDLTEIAQGEWEGLPHAEVRARWPNELAAWRRSPVTHPAPGGASLADAGARVMKALGGILAELDPAATTDTEAVADMLSFDPVPGYLAAEPAAQPPAENWAIAVAHDGIFRLALMSLLGVSHSRFWSFPFNLCAISIIGFAAGVPLLRAHNLADHLTPLADEERAAAEARGERRGAL